ncbi:MAG TPA: polysaccharide biosynthesis/export family protein [Cyclobacteriaceae bacterium]
MFKPGENFVPDPITSEALNAEKNYVIQKSDYLKLEVFSNKGERIIDPDNELSKQSGNVTQTNQKPELKYLVDSKVIVKFPMIDEFKIDSLTLRQAEEILQKLYNQYYKDCFVSLTFASKRVIVLGAVGGQVIPLINENVSLVEILAQAKGLSNDAKAQNIRVLRGDQVFLINLSTINGYKAGNLIIEPGDIVYVEPVRRPVAEAFRDYGAAATILISITSLIIVLTK